MLTASAYNSMMDAEFDDELIEEFLSPRKLRALTGIDDLDQVEYLEMKVDTDEMSLGNFGMYLPNLRHLKLSHSIIPSVRDLGTSLNNLEILWMPHCCLESVDGLVTMLQLREVYLAYNEITDVSPIGMLENLESLDLEGNAIEDHSNLPYLAMCPKLKSLSLEGNPMCAVVYPVNPNLTYRQTVVHILPNLEVLDDQPVGSMSQPSESVPSPAATTTTTTIISTPRPQSGSTTFDEHWSYIDTLLKETGLLAESENSNSKMGTIAASEVWSHDSGVDVMLSRGQLSTASGVSSSLSNTRLGSSSIRPGSNCLRPSSAQKRRSMQNCSTADSRLSTARSVLQSGGGGVLRMRTATAFDRSSTPGSVSIDESIDLTDESFLTAGRLICGNISKSLRSRKVASVNSNSGESSPRTISSFGDTTQRGKNTAQQMPGAARPITAHANLAATKRTTTKDTQMGRTAWTEETQIAENSEHLEVLLQDLQQWRLNYQVSREKVALERAPNIMKIDHDTFIGSRQMKVPTEHEDAAADEDDKNETVPVLENDYKAMPVVTAPPPSGVLQVASSSSIRSKRVTPLDPKQRISTGKKKTSAELVIPEKRKPIPDPSIQADLLELSKSLQKPSSSSKSSTITSSTATTTSVSSSDGIIARSSSSGLKKVSAPRVDNNLMGQDLRSGRYKPLAPLSSQAAAAAPVSSSSPTAGKQRITTKREPTTEADRSSSSSSNASSVRRVSATATKPDSNKLKRNISTDILPSKPRAPL